MECYEAALDNFRNARHELEVATVAYDQKRHQLRTQMYAQKMDGMKFTEEQIRSTTFTACNKEHAAYEKASAAFDIAKEELEYHKIRVKG